LVLIAVGVVLVLATMGADSCDEGGSSKGGSSETSPPMGSGQTCNHKLVQAVSWDYLADQGLAPAGDKDTAQIALAGAIVEVCQKGPASQSVEDAKQRVVDVLRKRYTGG
jgi:hypothetical protein